MMKATSPKLRLSRGRGSEKRSKRAAALRPLVRPPSGGRFTLREIRAALKAIEEEPV